MAGQELVRPSRDGDQFHYHWAARQCLRLLPGATDLVAVTIEGPSTAEAASDTIPEGEELIDVGFYYGDEERDRARLVHYVQLKHSTRHSGEPWTASGLQKTLEGFAQRYTRLLARFPADNVAQRFRFEFASNRPIDSKVQEALADLTSGAGARHSDVQQLLTRYSGLTGAQVQQFFRLFVVTGGEGDLWEQRHLLAQDLSRYLVGADSETPLELKELVTRKATTEFETDPSIRRHDVLRALKATEEQLRPAPCLLPDPKDTLPREQEQGVLRALLVATTPVIIHADGGVGKSVLAARLAASIPANSAAVLYDCFGDGLYRNAQGFRHRHRDALVQIANELAARGLCHPLVPTPHADVKQYINAFMGRLTQAAELLRAKDPNATLCLIVDAADNAEMAAEEQREPSSFVRSLISATLPQGVRVAFTCRSHRRSLLHAPPDAQEIALLAFSQAESARHLRTRYSDASDAETSEFAFLSSSNPRVQALALSRSTSLQEMLKQLGPEPTTVERAIEDLLDIAIARLKHYSSGVEAQHIDMICRGLAVFRPLVPVPVLAKVSGVSEGVVRSFVLDLGRPLILKGDSIHFFDEPTETWFRERYGPEATDLATFVERLRPLTTKNAYAAAALPQFLLQLGKFEELVQLALSDENLPSENPLEKRDVKLQRLRFALKACIQRRNYVAAAKLALKAGGECAGEQRQNQVIKEHTDVAGVLMAPDRIEGLVARRTFCDTWRGSHYAYDAGLLSGSEEHFAEASSRLRMAKDWLRAWARRNGDQRQHSEPVSTEDIAELAIVVLRLEGAFAAARFLKCWRPRHLSLLAGQLTGRRLIDLGRFDQLDALANAAAHDPWLLLGLCAEVNAVGRLLPTVSLVRLMRFLQRPRVRLPEPGWNDAWRVLDAVRSAIELALGGLPHELEAWAEVLRRYLPVVPPESISIRYGADRVRLWRAYALEAALRGQRVSVEAVTPTKDRQQASSRRAEEEEFSSEAGALIPWLSLSAEIACGRPPSDVSNAIQRAVKGTADAERRVYQDQKPVRQYVALEWLRILDATPKGQSDQAGALSSWISEQKPELRVDTLVALCRRAARGNGFERLAMDLGAKAYSALEASRDDAELRANSFLKLARAILTVSREEAREYFDHAVEIASRIGDENLERWVALLNLATAAAERETPRPRTAYRLSRIAELTYEYVERDKHFPWDSTVESLVDLCAVSSVAILSRWRDRRFGRTDWLLPIVVGRLLGKKLLSESTPIALAGITAEWTRVEDLKRALSSESDPAIRVVLARVAYRYIRVTMPSAQNCATLKELSEQYCLYFPDLERLSRAASVSSEGKNSARGGVHNLHGDVAKDSRVDWDTLFQNVDYGDSAVLRSRFADLRNYDRSYGHEAFYREALIRVKPGREPDFIRAVATWPDFGFFSLKDLLQALPSPLPNQVALRKALREVIISVCRREPHRCQRIGWFENPPYHALRVGGLISDKDLAVAALEGVAAQVDRLDARELFQSIGPLALVLSPAQADEALDFGFDLLDEILKPEDGDGEWCDDLRPRGTLIDAFAGYIWAGLGSAAASERWQHAHVVRTIVELGWCELFYAVIKMVDADGGAFADQRLAFYGWHARQWFLIGLGRGAIENPTALRPAHVFLQKSFDTKHVVIRELAAQVLQTLRAAGELDAAAVADHVVNRPKAVQVYGGFVKEEDDAPEIKPEVEEGDKYFFGFDVGPYWFAPLGRAFGLSQEAIERRAVAVVRKALGWEGSLDWREDGRTKRKIFYDGENSHSHGSLPRADDAMTYHSYHAMMIVAADLLGERPVLRRKEEFVDEFVDWMSRYTLTRCDGRWVADRRGPRLVPEIATHQEHWRWSVSASYLNQQLTTDDGLKVLWGGWQNGDSDRYERVAIRCALVSIVGASSLLAALQTASELDRFVLPYASEVSLRPEGDEEDDEDDYKDQEAHDGVDAGLFRLSGWLSHETEKARLDEYDPWGEGIPFPGPAPSNETASRLDLRQREDGTVWETARGGTIRAELWVQTQQSGRRDEAISGERLSANVQFLKELLAASSGCVLILSVSIRRHPSRYDRDDDDFSGLQQSYVRYYLMGEDGVATPL